MKLLDCTLRDGGYYNNWNFPKEVVSDYLNSMASAGVDIVELGMRSLKNEGFKGAAGFTTDSYLSSLQVPPTLQVAVMVNASELLGKRPLTDCLASLFPLSSGQSSVSVVRIACHVHEFEDALPAAQWLKARGFTVGFNLMQVADRTQEEVEALSKAASQYDIDALYFADSMGSMSPDHCRTIIRWLRAYWKGDLGIHTHDNMGMALQNTLAALDEGVTWLDATVTGMGRGPGNARTEELVIEIAERRNATVNVVPLMSVIRRYFQPLKNQCGWGSNPYYYLSGKYGIHPTYIQEMLSDSRYDEEDILAVIQHLRVEGGKSFSLNTLDSARHFYRGDPTGNWQPREFFENSKVLLLGTGPGVAEHRDALIAFIKEQKPIVVALNTQSAVDADLINFRVACHPVRLLADCEAHTKLPQPLITPYSMLPRDVKASLGDKEILDFGLNVFPDTFKFESHSCTVPTSLVVAYALAVATAGGASQVFMAGFDGYGADDPRNAEMDRLLSVYKKTEGASPILAITPTRYRIDAASVYAL